MSNLKNITESGLVLTGQGKLKGLVVNSHSSGTAKIYDGVEAGANAVSTLTSTGALAAATHATATLTSSGAGSVAATHATTVFTKTDNFLDGTKGTGYITSDETIPTVADTVVLGARTYTFAALGGTAVNSATAVTVPLGNNATETMVNLYNALRTDPLFDVVHTSAFVITVTYKTIGTAGNVTATEDSTHLAWDDGSTLTGGTDAETITIGSKVYTMKDVLDTESTATAVQVKIGATLTASLLNIKYAINADEDYAGVSYGFGTVIDPNVVCTASDGTTFTIFGRVVGATLNAVATTETCTDGAFADTTLGGGTGDSDAGVATTNSTVTIGTTVYTQVDILTETLGAVAVPYQFLRGASEATMLDALKAAINATSVGTLCSTGTVAHTSVIATTNADTTQIIRGRTPGNAYDALATTETMANTAWGQATMVNGVATATATLTIGTRVYTFVTELTEDLGAEAIADQILYETSVAVALDNMKMAINGSGVAGTEYSTGTVKNGQVKATTNANDSQIIQALNTGSASNTIATTSTIVNHAWTSTVMASGTGETGKVLFNTITFSAVATTGERTIPLYDTEFVNGLYVTIGGTADISLAID